MNFPLSESIPKKPAPQIELPRDHDDNDEVFIATGGLTKAGCASHVDPETPASLAGVIMLDTPDTTPPYVIDLDTPDDRPSLARFTDGSGSSHHEAMMIDSPQHWPVPYLHFSDTDTDR